MVSSGLTESIIQNEVGCGPFQVMVVLLLFALVKLPAFCNMVFMAFGNYNPGWRCLDNGTAVGHSINETTDFSNVSISSPAYNLELICSDYEACHDVEFNPESSTIVAEWKLVCDRDWIASLILSIQMCGCLVGSFISGYTADAFGRKKTMYGSLGVVCLLNFASIFSSRWEIFAVFRFFIGIMVNIFDSLNYIYPAEFLTKKWRGPVAGIPGWSISGIIFGLVTMALKDWRYVLTTIGGFSFIAFIPVVWVPESLRWLGVKDKKDEFKRVAEKMARWNKKTIQERFNYEYESKQEESFEPNQIDSKKYTFLDLYHHGYRLITINIGISWLCMSFIYYALGFGIKALSGNFYINYILISAVLVPFCIFSIFGPNLLGRTKFCCASVGLAGIALLAAVIFELYTDGRVRYIGTLVLMMAAVIGIDAAYAIQSVHVGEIYPTVARALGLNSAYVMARVGGIMAPFAIPKDDTSVYIWYLVTGSLALLCCVLVSRLPETKGKPLRETFEKDVHLQEERTVDDYFVKNGRTPCKFLPEKR